MSKLMLVKPSVKTITKGLDLCKNTLIKQSPIILTTIGCAGVVTTGVMAYKAGIKAEKVLEEMRSEKCTENLTIEETIKATWKIWIPPVVSGVLTVGAVVAGAAINEKRRAALAGLYAMSEAALKQYQDKAEELYGKNGEQKIRDAVAQDEVKDLILPPEETPDGQSWWKDPMSGRLFLANAGQIQAAAGELAQQIYGGDMCASLNEFYDILSEKTGHYIEHTELGNAVGWNLSNLPKPYLSCVLTSDGRPVGVLSWDDRNGAPQVDYRDI